MLIKPLLPTLHLRLSAPAAAVAMENARDATWLCRQTPTHGCEPACRRRDAEDPGDWTGCTEWVLGLRGQGSSAPGLPRLASTRQSQRGGSRN